MSEVIELPEDMAGMIAFFRRYQQLELLEAGWRDEAACAMRTVPPLRHFFPDPTHLVPGSKKIRRARRVCAGCPVRRPCLQLAIDEELTGVWAGTTDDQRAALAYLPREQRVEALEEAAFEATTSGPWRVASEAEWKAAGLVDTPT